jgi:hypothetical protein
MATWYDEMMAAAQKQQQIPPQDKYKAFTTPGWKPAANPLPADYVPPEGGPSLEKLNSEPTWQLALNQLGGGISTIPNSGNLPLLLQNLLSGVQSMDTTGSAPPMIAPDQFGSPRGMESPPPYIRPNPPAPRMRPEAFIPPTRQPNNHPKMDPWESHDYTPYPWGPQQPQRPMNPYTVNPQRPGPAQPIGGTPWTPPPGYLSESPQGATWDPAPTGNQGIKPTGTGLGGSPWAPRARYS